MARLAKADGHSSTETTKANIKDAPGPPLRKHAHSGARCQSPQQAAEGESTVLQLTLRVDPKGGKFKIDSSACLHKHLQEVLPPKFLNNLFNIISEHEQNARIAPGPSQYDDVLGSWQSFDKSKGRYTRSAKKPSKMKPLPPSRASTSDKKPSEMKPFSPGQISTSEKKRKGRTQVLQLHPELEAINIDSSEEDLSDDDEADVKSCKRKWIRIGDAQAVNDCYHDLFEAIQQIPCKYIAKAWVKVKAPKKQSQHPYNGGKWKAEAIAKFGKDNPGAFTMPGWWPPKNCRHKEPDHIKKPERIVLLIHLILNAGIPCADLEESTKELPQQLIEATKPFKHYLDDIYFLRRKQGAFERGEIDDTTMVSVRVHEKAGKARNPPKKSTKSSTSAETTASYRSVGRPQLTPRITTSRPCQGPTPLSPFSNFRVDEPRCKQVLEGNERFRQTQSVVAPNFPKDALPYQTAGRTQIKPNLMQAYNAQELRSQTQPGVSIPAAPQVTGPQSLSSRGLQSPLSKHVRSSAPSMAEAHNYYPIQQTPAIKTERLLPVPIPWSSEPSLVPQTSLDYRTLDDFPGERPRTSAPALWSYESSAQENGLPSIPSENSLLLDYDNFISSFQATPTDTTQVPQLVGYQDPFPELDELNVFA